MGHELDSTLNSFPSYAELTQTQAWAAKPSPRVRADTQGVGKATEVSHASRYAEGPVLGVGGMGKVVLAKDERIGRDVAVKVLHPERELEPHERARFLREAQVQGQLEHPSIVPVYDIDRRADGTTFFTMRRVLGRTLHAILDDLRKGVPAAKQRYTQRELLTAFATVCLTIDYAHSRGVVHRDLKPANIMLGDFGEVYVLDWGLARLVDEQGDSLDEPQERLSMPGSFLGTPMYMAPEQMADPDVGPRADIYALGMILFELLTFERARDPNALFAPVDARPSVRTPYRNVAPELETICVKATEMDPKDRYASPRAMQEAINRYLEGDREVEARRALASKHVQTARIALGKSIEPNANYEQERGRAITELGRAVALDPQNAEYFEMLAELMSAQPARVPEEVMRAVDANDRKIIQLGAKHALTAASLWWLTLPILLWIGFADPWQAIWIGIPVVVTMIVNAVMWRKSTKLPTQLLAITAVTAMSMMVTRLYGPFVLMPVFITTNAIVLQAHPLREIRIWGVVVSILAIVVASALEWTGAWPSSYAFTGDTWTIVPQLLELPRIGTFVFLTLVFVASISVPAAFIGKLRAELSEAQMRLATQAWHFKQLGAQLIGRPDTAPGR